MVPQVDATLPFKVSLEISNIDVGILDIALSPALGAEEDLKHGLFLDLILSHLISVYLHQMDFIKVLQLNVEGFLVFLLEREFSPSPFFRVSRLFQVDVVGSDKVCDLGIPEARDWTYMHVAHIDVEGIYLRQCGPLF